MPLLATESDWLDQTLQFLGWLVGSSAYWLLEKALGALAYLFEFCAHHWVLTLIASAFLLLRWVRHRHLPNLILLEYAIDTRFTQARDEWRTKKARSKKAREKNWLRSVRPRDFEAHIASLRRKRDVHRQRSSILLNTAATASDNEADILRSDAERHRQAADRLQGEIDDLERLWESRAIADLHHHAHLLVDKLIFGADSEARRALAELNRIWRKIDWRSFIPYGAMGPGDQKRAIQYIEIMVSNAHVGEARNAFAFLEKILGSYRSSWKKAAYP